jgi:hypothetical protein
MPEPNSGKSRKLVAVIYPHAGGYVARIIPPGIVCFSEDMEGLQREIEAALENYSADVDRLIDAAGEFPRSLTLADWEAAEDASTIFIWDPEEGYRH